MKRRIGGNLNIGTSSLLLIFIVLSLVSFAVLSLTSALTDKRMVEASMERSSDYYAACSEAEHQLATMNDSLVPGENKSFEVSISDSQTLLVSIDTHEPDAKGYKYTISEWKVINTESHEIDNHLNLLIK